ncbi:polysaccharide deacetylase family protein [Patescibacteria group bacterium]
MREVIKKLGKYITKASEYVIVKTFPSYYFKSFYKNNTSRTDWKGKRSCLSLSFDCDYAEDVVLLPRLLNVLSPYSFKASFACIGKLIEKYPKEHMGIIKKGHQIINHTYSHPNNEKLNPDQKFNEIKTEQRKTEIEKCHTICRSILQYEPTGFRTPHFGNLHTEDVYGILNTLGYKYSSSVSAIKTSSFGLPFVKNNIVEFPLSNCPKHPFAVFDTWHSLGRGSGKHKKGEKFYQLCKELIDIGIRTDSYINVYFDPQDVANLKEFQLLLDYIEEKKQNIWIATYKEIFEELYEGKRN